MEPNIRLKTPTRWEIVHLKKNGFSDREVAQNLGISKTGVNSTWKKYNETNHVKDLDRSGRPRKLSQRDMRALLTSVKRDPTSNSKELAQNLNLAKPNHNQVSPPTIRRILFRNNIIAKIRPTKWFISEKNKKGRVDWAKNHQNWTVEKWKNVIFTDECKIEGGNGRKYYRCRRGDDRANIKPVIKDNRRVSVMIWGALSSDGILAFKFIDENIDSEVYIDTIYDKLNPYFNKFSSGELIFQQDLAPAHRSKKTLDFFNNYGIEPLEWSPQSPDLNIIENVWMYLKRRLKVLYHDQDELKKDVTRILNDIEISFVIKLYESLPNRCNEVILRKGEPTRY